MCLAPPRALADNATPPTASASDTPSEADALLTLQEQQAETVDTMDSTSTSTFMADGVTRTLKTRVLMDKPNGRLKLQHFTDKGDISVELLVEGSTVYVRGRQHPAWQTLPMDAQTQATLVSMGANFGTDSLGGIAGLEKTDGAALVAAGSPATDTAAAASETSSPEARLGLLRRNGWNHSHLAKADQRIRRRLEARRTKQQWERVAGADDKGKGLKALRIHFRGNQDKRPWDEELVKLDADGQAVERTQFIRADRWPGGKDKIPAGAHHWEQVAPGAASDVTDTALIELGHSTVLRSRRINGATLPDEGESVSHSYLGDVTLHTAWEHHNVNQAVDPKEFDRR